MTSETQPNLEEFLSAVTDALLDSDDLAHVEAVHQLFSRYDVPRASAESFIRLIQRLDSALRVIPPSPAFVDRLRADLVGREQRSLVGRVRHMPARVQIAAGIVAVAGFVLLSRRRLGDLAGVTDAEIIPSQQI